MRVKENVTLYYCDFCKKELKRKHAMEKHELLCFNNPINDRPCFHCNHLEKKEVDHYIDTGYGEHKMVLNLFHCKLKNLFLYTHKNEFKKNYYDLGDDFNEPMPIKCAELDKELNNWNFSDAMNFIN